MGASYEDMERARDLSDRYRRLGTDRVSRLVD